MTAATPMMMPSIVRVARILFFRMAWVASRTKVMLFMLHSSLLRPGQPLRYADC